ncbi:MAG: regulatory signaling modulator protein AmpE, partial [Gammaproteobacteria bacterium]
LWPGVMMTALFSQAVVRFFGPLCWFLILGPVGAMAYTTLEIARKQVAEEAPESPLAEGIETVYAVLSWIPTRLLALAFALVGSFDATMQAWRSTDVRCRDRMPTYDEALAICSGYGALGLEPDWLRSEDDAPMDTRSLRAALGLVQRSVVVWLVGLGLLSVFFARL